MPTITKPKRSDYPEIVALINEADQVFLTIHSAAEARKLEVGQEDVANLVAGEKLRRYLVVKEGEAIVAFVSFRLKNVQTAWISLLYVKVNRQHRGYGVLLIKRIEAWAKRSGAQVVALETDKKAGWAVNFYLKLGYKLLKPTDLKRSPFDQLSDKAPACGRCLFGKEI
jgi:GNAT superfamily N-acetyltransferase